MRNEPSPSLSRFGEASIAGLMLCLALAGTAQAASPHHNSQGAEIVVNSIWDVIAPRFPGEPASCTLRDAIQAANDNVAVGGCDAGMEAKEGAGRLVDQVDRIVFDLGSGTPVVYIWQQLPPITEPLAIDGATGGATRVAIDGSSGLVRFGNPTLMHGLILTERYSSVENLVISNFSGNGILITDLDGDGHISTPPTGPEIDEPTVGDGRLEPCGPYGYPSDPDQCPPPGGGGGIDVPEGTAGGGFHYIAGNFIGTDPSGTAAAGNGTGAGTEAGVAIANYDNLVGGPRAHERNVISGNLGHGLIVAGAGNRIEGNYVGTDASGTGALPNQWDGVHASGGQFASARFNLSGNTIAFNAVNGLTGGYNYVAALANSIHDNGELGIDMADPGLTANDPSGARVRPPNAPVLRSASHVWLSRPPYFGTQLRMELNYQSTWPATVELFHSPSCDPSGHGEGATFVTSHSLTVGGTRNITLLAPGILPQQGVFTATMTGTDYYGNPSVTSEFSACLP